MPDSVLSKGAVKVVVRSYGTEGDTPGDYRRDRMSSIGVDGRVEEQEAAPRCVEDDRQPRPKTERNQPPSRAHVRHVHRDGDGGAAGSRPTSKLKMHIRVAFQSSVAEAWIFTNFVFKEGQEH